MNYDYDLMIIGGGSAGLSLASAAAQIGVKVVLIDREKLGGDCLHFGCVPSKALIKSAKVAHKIKHAEKYGLKKISPKLDWSDITERISKIQSGIQEHDHPDRFRSYGADVIFGEAKFTGKHSVKITLNQKLKSIQQTKYKSRKVTTLTAKKICIATGSKPRIPEIKGLKETGFTTNEQIFSSKIQPKSLAIIGGGVIATELAQALQRLGSQVHIIETHETYLGRFDADIHEFLYKKLTSEGVEIHQDTQPTLVRRSLGEDGKKVLKLKTGTKKHELKVDEILVAAGRVPNTNLNLEKAGIKFSDSGIPVNKKCRTNLKHITAIGDVNGKSMFTHTANYEAGIVFTNEILHIPSKTNYQSIGWTIYSDPEVAHIGHDENSAKKAGLKFTVQKFNLAKNDRALTESINEGFVKILVSKKDKVLGVQIISPRAGEMIREWQLVISQGIKLSKVAQSTYIYPTFGEANKWVASQYYSPKLFNPKVKKILRFIFGYRGKV